ncbi:MAG TPA: isocitrate lyase/phosphoenolpyruvate mutase family protein [Solirubrobacteraceae bacterium]|nr:isocitrate lyase/phosphoenolpyruvate mutase family protein [Solirubrobacteraceae bacterium]
MSVTDRFRALHETDELFLMPNAWDVGSARLLEHLGFRAIATTSSGSAAARGRLDGELDREAAVGHGAELAAAVEVPVSADLENCFADPADGVAETIAAAAATGLAGASVEDWSGSTIYEREHAAERVRAAVEGAAGRLVITARAENLIHDRDDLDDTIARLQAFAAAGADVLFAPGLRSAEQIRAVLSSVEAPLSVLVVPGVPPVSELAELGVRRVSIGGAFAFAAYGALVRAARELLDPGTYGYGELAALGRDTIAAAFG